MGVHIVLCEDAVSFGFGFGNGVMACSHFFYTIYTVLFGYNVLGLIFVLHYIHILDLCSYLCLYSVLNSCLLHIQNEALVKGELSYDLRIALTNILEKFVLSWQQEEQRKMEKEEEEASIYRFKSQVHGDERSEEERLEQDFREIFPLFDQVC